MPSTFTFNAKEKSAHYTLNAKAKNVLRYIAAHDILNKVAAFVFHFQAFLVSPGYCASNKLSFLEQSSPYCTRTAETVKGIHDFTSLLIFMTWFGRPQECLKPPFTD